MRKIELKKELKSLYQASKKVQEIDSGEGQFLCIRGLGEPGGEAFQESLQKLYGAAFTLKFSLKLAAVMDFSISPLECLYLDDPASRPMDQWRWVQLIRVPGEVTAGQFDTALSELKSKKGIDAGSVGLERLREGQCIQVLHLGPFDQVGSAYGELSQYMKEHRLKCGGPPHEVYLSDPSRTAPEKLRTIVRIPVEKA